MVDETVQDILYSISKQKIEVTHSYHCQIMADKDRLGQVLINFITNAIKYSPDDKKVKVEVSQGSKGQVAVSIKDRGIGIAEEDLKYILTLLPHSQKWGRDLFWFRYRFIPIQRYRGAPWWGYLCGKYCRGRLDFHFLPSLLIRGIRYIRF